MIIPKNISLHGIEGVYKNVSLKMPSELSLPITLDNKGAFGTQAALIQLIVTWARRAENPTLHLYGDSKNIDRHILQLGKQPYGLVALTLCSRIIDQKRNQIDKFSAIAPLTPLVDAMFHGQLRRTSTFKGHRPTNVHLCAIQNARREFIHPFYEAPD